MYVHAKISVITTKRKLLLLKVIRRNRINPKPGIWCGIESFH